MANAEILIAGSEDIPILTKLYNEIFRPPRDEQFFRRRFMGRRNILLLLALVDQRPVGYSVGFELKPSVFFAWLAGVLPELRRQGIASQLMEAQHAWAAENGYSYIRIECHNAHRAVIHMAIALNYDIIGLRWDSERSENLIIFERSLTDA
ncbi:MAG: GNAT family N-acetyltransferase [Phycisphaerae bacterium]|nr:GNAT family N-acetyltransferase [Phycisphaerae bacterium]